MLEEVVNTSNSLERLTKESDFNFNDTLEKDIHEIHIKVLEQKSKKKIILDLIKLAKEKDTIDSSNLNYSKEIINLINSNINSLYNLEMKLNGLCQDFTDSYISNLFNSENDETFDTVKSNIDSYSSDLSEFSKKFEENNVKIDNFLKDYTKDNNKNSNIENDEHTDNPYLIVSEEEKKVFLPYKISEINSYLEQYPNVYSDFEDVVKKEFIIPLHYYTKNPIVTRFRETYSLIHDREGKSVFEALKYSFDLMFKDDLNPTIIAACKTQQQLDDYIECLEHQDLDSFKHFKIQFYITPLAAKV